MASQTAGNVLAAIKRQDDIDTPAAAGAGAEQVRLVDSPGLGLNRSQIESEERRRDQLRNMGRLGGKDVGGSFNTEVTVGGAFDMLAESIARGEYEAKATHADISADTQLKRVVTPEVPIYHAYSVEQYDADIDASELFVGTRLTQLQLSLRPNGMATAGWTFMGLDRQIVDPAEAPYFTDPGVTEGLPLIADDSAIFYKGTQITTLTGIDLTFAINAALQPVIGNFVSPDVFMNILSISGSATAVRQDLAALSDFDDETEFELRAVMAAPGDEPKEMFAVVLPRVKISGIDAPFLGGDAAKVETRELMVAPAAGSVAAEFYTSTDTVTPTA